MARPRHHRWRPSGAQRGGRDFRSARADPGIVAGGGKRTGSRCGPRNPVHAGQGADKTGAARPGFVFHSAIARRGASLRDRLASQGAQKGHSRSRAAGDSPPPPSPPTFLAAPFPNPLRDPAASPPPPPPGALVRPGRVYIFSQWVLRAIVGPRFGLRAVARSVPRQVPGPLLPLDAGRRRVPSRLDAGGCHLDPVSRILVSGLREYLAGLR